MITKIYKASTLSEAIDTIKKELGSKAVIVSTKKISAQKGIFRQIPASIEVTVNVDERHLTQEQIEKMQESPKREKGRLISFDIGEKMSGTKENISEKVDVNSLKKQMGEMEKERDLLRGEVRALEAFLKGDGSDDKALDKVFNSPEYASDKIVMLLKNQQVGEELCKQWLSQSESLAQNLTSEERLDECALFFLKQFIPFERDLPRILAFCGTSGSGKSLTIAKLASQMKKQGKKVLIASVDEKLEENLFVNSLSEKMTVPYLDLPATKNIRTAIKSCDEYDHILIDTPALSLKNKGSFDSITRQLKKITASLVLVLSAQETDNQRVVDCLKSQALLGIVYTKLDEAFSVGPILDLIYQNKLPSLYFGVSREVSMGLEMASGERLVSILLSLDVGEDEKPSEEENNKKGEFKPIQFNVT